MGDTLIVQSVLVVILMMGFTSVFIISKYNRKFGGLAIILTGITISTLGTTLPDIANQTAIGATLVFAAGLMVLLDGVVNKR